MLDILIGSLMVALALVVVFWVLIFGRPLVRETKNSKGAVETPPVADIAEPETVNTYHCEDLKIWCRAARKPHIIKRPSVNANRIVESVEEHHLFAGGVDVTVSNTDSEFHQILSLRGTTKDVKAFIGTFFCSGTQYKIFRELGL